MRIWSSAIVLIIRFGSPSSSSQSRPKRSELGCSVKKHFVWICLLPRHTWHSSSPSSFRTSPEAFLAIRFDRRTAGLPNYSQAFREINVISEAVSSFSLIFRPLIVKMTYCRLFIPSVSVGRADNTHWFGWFRFLGSYLVLRVSFGSAFELSLLKPFLSKNTADMISKRIISTKVQITTKTTRRWRFSLQGLFNDIPFMWGLFNFADIAIFFANKWANISLAAPHFASLSQTAWLGSQGIEMIYELKKKPVWGFYLPNSSFMGL